MDAIFRAVHTIKGMSATMGYTAVATLSHELETLLDGVRRGVRAVDAPLMELLFQSADVLENAIEGAVQGRLDAHDVGPIVARIRAEMVRGRASAAVPSSTVVAALEGGWTVSAPAGDGLLVRVRLVQGTPLKAVRAFIVVQAAKKLGEVTGCSPALDALQADDFGHDFALRLLTEREPSEIEATLRKAGDVEDVRVGEDDAANAIPRQTMDFNVAELAGLMVEAAAAPLRKPRCGSSAACASICGGSTT